MRKQNFFGKNGVSLRQPRPSPAQQLGWRQIMSHQKRFGRPPRTGRNVRE